MAIARLRDICRVGFLTLSSLSLTACGIEVGNPKKPNSGNNGASVYLTDSNAASGAAATVIDEGLLLTFDAGNDSLGSDLQLTAMTTADESICKPIDGGVFLTRNRSGSRVRDISVRDKALSYQVAFTDAIERNLTSSTDGVLRCDLTGTRFRFVRADFVDLTRIDTFERTRTLTVREPDSNQVKRSDTYTSKGRRDNFWERLTTASGAQLLRQTTTVALSKTLEFTAGARPLSLETSITTSDDAPIVIETLSSDSLTPFLDWTQKTVNVEGFTSRQKDGAVITVAFQDVVFKKDGGCLPSSGLINGSLTVPDLTGEEQSIAFKLDFNDTVPIISFDDREPVEYLPEACDLK